MPFSLSQRERAGVRENVGLRQWALEILRTASSQFAVVWACNGAAMGGRGSARRLQNSRRRFVFRLPLPHPNPLPLGEGAASSAPGKVEAPRLLKRLAAVLPLPAGEGRGEGELDELELCLRFLHAASERSFPKRASPRVMKTGASPVRRQEKRHLCQNQQSALCAARYIARSPGSAA